MRNPVTFFSPCIVDVSGDRPGLHCPAILHDVLSAGDISNAVDFVWRADHFQGTPVYHTATGTRCRCFNEIKVLLCCRTVTVRLSRKSVVEEKGKYIIIPRFNKVISTTQVQSAEPYCLSHGSLGLSPLSISHTSASAVEVMHTVKEYSWCVVTHDVLKKLISLFNISWHVERTAGTR